VLKVKAVNEKVVDCYCWRDFRLHYVRPRYVWLVVKFTVSCADIDIRDIMELVLD